MEDFALRSKLWPNNFGNMALILLATRVLPTSPNFGQAKHCQKILPLFHRDILKAESVVVAIVPILKNFHVENFWWQSDLRKKSIFHEFIFRLDKKIRWPAADSILMPLSFHPHS